MNYEEEYEETQKTSNVWKPELGIHKVVILDEPEETVYEDNDGSKTPQIKLAVKVGVDPEVRTWFLSKGKKTSCYGQLIAVGRHKGKLKDEVITVQVQTQKNSKNQDVRRYSIPEAIKAEEELKKLKPVEQTVA